MRAYPVFVWLFEASVGALALVPLILVVRRFLRRTLGSKLIYALWLLVIVRLLLPLQLPTPFAIEVENVNYPVSVVETAARDIRSASYQISDHVAYAALEQPYERITPLNMAAYEAMQPNVRGYVWLGCYLLSVTIVAVIMIWRNLRFRRRLECQTLGELDGAAAEQYHALAKQLGICAPKAYLVDPLDSACLVGWLRPLIALPVMNASDPYIQLHELCHRKGGDAVWGLIRNLCCALFWFHPLVWLAARVSRIDCELACDERVTESLNSDEKIRYAELLVRMAACRRTPRVGVLATGMSMTGTRMKQRVKQILANHRLHTWVLVVAVFIAVSLLATCFATATVIPQEIQEPFDNTASVPQDQWLARDAAIWFPDSVFDASQRDHTAISTRYGSCCLFNVSNEDAIHYAQANLKKENRDWVFTHDYGTMTDGLQAHTAAVYSPTAATWQRERYFCYAACYDKSGNLLSIGREPAVCAETERLWQRCSGETIGEVEYEARNAEVRAEYAAWADAHKNDFTASVSAAKSLAEQIGLKNPSPVKTRYQAYDSGGEFYHLQHITLQTADGQQITFTVEMATERVLALRFTDDYGLLAEQTRMAEDGDAGEQSALTADPAWIKAQGLAAIARYFGYGPSGDTSVTVAKRASPYDNQRWWDVTAANGNLRYRAEISDSGALRRVTRIPCNVVYNINNDCAGAFGSSADYNLDEKTVFWLNGGAFLDVEQAYPPEAQQALDFVSAYLKRSGLPGQMTEMVLYTSCARQLEREYDVGIEFTFAIGVDEAGHEQLIDVLYSTLQQDIGHIDFRVLDDVG